MKIKIKRNTLYLGLETDDKLYFTGKYISDGRFIISTEMLNVTVRHSLNFEFNEVNKKIWEGSPFLFSRRSFGELPESTRLKAEEIISVPPLSIQKSSEQYMSLLEEFSDLGPTIISVKGKETFSRKRLIILKNGLLIEENHLPFLEELICFNFAWKPSFIGENGVTGTNFALIALYKEMGNNVINLTGVVYPYSYHSDTINQLTNAVDMIKKLPLSLKK